ncbi:hypothetical protein [Streptomyces sp. NPDC023327]|uniref:hypothetical protein n=1 Tax=Streptomyces sp. NPDC023327 TaxID=3157088 RepID=UPI0033FE6E50
MVEVTGVHDADENAEDAALGKLSDALGIPSRAAAEKAKALFPFIAFAAAMDDGAMDDRAMDDRAVSDGPMDDEESPAALDDRPSGSAGRYPAAPGR